MRPSAPSSQERREGSVSSSPGLGPPHPGKSIVLAYVSALDLAAVGTKLEVEIWQKRYPASGEEPIYDPKNAGLESMTIPAKARVVIIGGGIVGCSIAHHPRQARLVRYRAWNGRS